jgi:hypothetical protein
MRFFLLTNFLLLAAFFSKASASKRFIFRQDDIEDFYHNTVQANMINWFIDNEVGISAGIISNSFNGGDPIIYNVLKRCVSVGMDKCTIWNHGTDAVYHYKDAASVEEAQQRVQACDTKIKTYFPGYKPFLMTPHQNSWGPYLLQALKNLDYKVISASAAAYSGMKWDLSLSPMQMPQQATTGDFSDAIHDFVGVPVSKTVSDCEAAAARGEVCVIMTHPHEFANGAYNFETLAALVQSLKDHGFTSTNFYTVMNEQLAANSAATVIPTEDPTQTPVSTPVPTIATTTVPSTLVPTNQPVASSTVPTNQPVSSSTAPTNQPVDSSTAAPTNQPVVSSTVAPTNQPVDSSTAAPTNQPVTTAPSLRTESPSQSPTISLNQLQYTAIIHVKSSANYQYQWFNVLETIRNVEKNQNLIDLQYSGNTEVSSSEFDISIKMTFGLTGNSNPHSGYDTTARLLNKAINQQEFNNFYYSLGADKKTTFTRVSFQGDGTYEINENYGANDSNSKKSGLFSFPMNGANISILFAISFAIVLFIVIVGYFLYQRCYQDNGDSDSIRKRSNTLTSNEESLTPSERFVKLELNNHYSLPKSDNNQFVEDACLHRHGLKLPGELENV